MSDPVSSDSDQTSASTAGASGTPPARWSARVRQWWHGGADFRSKGRNAIGNSFRWVFTGFLLAFLLVLTVAINEALNFQSRAGKVAGSEDVARRAILVLHELRENGELKGERALPFGSMAVRLDAIESAREGLSRFRGFAGPDAAGSDAETADVEQQTAEFLELRARLEQNVNGLESDLFSQNPGIKVARGLVEIEETVDDLEEFTVDIKAVEKYGITHDLGQELQDQVRRLRIWITEIRGQLNIEPGNRVGENNLNHLQDLVDRLNQMEGSASTVEAYRFRPLVKRPEKEVAQVGQDNGKWQVASASSVPQLLQAVYDLKPPPPPIDFEASNQQYESLLKEIGLQDQLIRTHLSGASPEFALAIDIASNLNEMRDHLEVLTALKPDPTEFQYTNGTDQAGGVSAREKYNVALGAMATALQNLVQTLKTRTPVIALAEVMPSDGGDGGLQPSAKAQTILGDFIALERFGEVLRPFQLVGLHHWIGGLGRIGFEPQQLATLSRDSLNLLFVLFVGAIGSVIYMTKKQLSWALQGHRLSSPPMYSMAWFFVRPLFGVFVAFAAYLMVRAGQMALGDDNAGLPDTFNLPILSVVALFAGLLSWHALDAIENRGKVWFSSQAVRQNLWATGLDSALQQASHDRGDCATQVDRSLEQVDRWTAFRDPVTPEMQDRIAGWLDRPITEIFSERVPPALRAGAGSTRQPQAGQREGADDPPPQGDREPSPPA